MARCFASLARTKVALPISLPPVPDPRQRHARISAEQDRLIVLKRHRIDVVGMIEHVEAAARPLPALDLAADVEDQRSVGAVQAPEPILILAAGGRRKMVLAPVDIERRRRSVIRSIR